jgi:hypothetical protein
MGHIRDRSLAASVYSRHAGGQCGATDPRISVKVDRVEVLQPLDLQRNSDNKRGVLLIRKSPVHNGFERSDEIKL